MTERAFDIWLHGFPRDTREAPPVAISRVFGIPVQAAEALIATLPRVVKRDASENQAERLVHALEAIGGLAEAIPTRVVPAPVLVVGTHPVEPRAETLVRHAPRIAAPREHPILGSPAGSGATIKLGTQELATYQAMSPNDTLVDREPPSWLELEGPRATVSEAPAPEARGRWDDLELAPPNELEPSISLALSARPPLASAQDIAEMTLTPHLGGASGPPAWQSPMALPPRDAPLRSLGMRPVAERSRFARSRSQHPPSMRVAAAKADTGVTEALIGLSRGDLKAASRASPTLIFLLVLLGVTLAFLLAYAAL